MSKVKNVPNYNEIANVPAESNGNGAHSAGRAPRYVPQPRLMELPDALQLNLDCVGQDDFFIFADPETDLQWRKDFMNSIVVGGIEKYHFTLIPELSEIIAEHLRLALPQGKKKRT